MEDSKRRARRRHDAELKFVVLAQCAEPGASIAQIALAHGLNANLVHKWRRLANARQAVEQPASASAQFIALAMPPTATLTAEVPAPAKPPGDICIELRRAATAVNIRWPVAASADCAAWMRELLR